MGNSYSDYQLIQTFLDNLQQGVIYSDQISSHKAEFRREEKMLNKNHYPYLSYKLITLTCMIR